MDNIFNKQHLIQVLSDSRKTAMRTILYLSLFSICIIVWAAMISVLVD